MSDDEERRVVVVDVRMPFMSMVTFMVKWAVAAVPAVLILAVLWTAVTALIGAFTGGGFVGGAGVGGGWRF
ncbi:MAG TPA: hypothetical protein VKA14_08175 [Gammaproteobacteria bacterium]|nr:hypothetical protein [Gammaproteobacteria bacterium]